MVGTITVAAVTKALGPAIGRAAGGASGKAGGLLFSAWRNRRYDKNVRKLVEQEGRLLADEAVAAGLDPGVYQPLAVYVHSPDFANVCLQLAVQALASPKPALDRHNPADPVWRLLHNGLANALPGHPSGTVTDIAKGVYDLALNEVVRASADLHKGYAQPKEVRAQAVRVAANIATGAVRCADFMADAERLQRFAKFEEQLLAQIRFAHSYMRLPHAGTSRKVPYERLFVEPGLTGFEKVPAEGGSRSIHDLLVSAPRIVVLGAPGGGKSTLALKLTHDIARDELPGIPARVPLLLVLRDFAEDLKNKKLTISSYLEAACRSPYNVEPPPGAIDFLLLSGRALVIFDGLDELLDVSVRRDLVSSIESFANLYPAVPILATSRKVGYDEAPLDAEHFAVGAIGPLESGQVKEYAGKWFDLDESVSASRRKDLARAFVEDSSFVEDLRTNPLMLSLMCGIYATEHYIPANRPDVYKKCAELLFERWDKQRGIITPLPFDAHVRLAINALALWMHSAPELQKGLPRDRLERFITRFLLDKRFDNEAEAENAARQFVEFCTGRAWVLTDVGSTAKQELYGFTHRTFLEYFAANQLVRLNTSAPALFAILRDRIARAEWDVVAQLSLHILSNHVEDGADDFLSLLLDHAGATDDTDQKYNLASFAARTLTFIVPKPSVIIRICQLAVGLVTEPAETPSPSIRAYAELTVCSAENFPAVSRAVCEAVHARLKADAGDRTALLMALYPGMAINSSRHLKDREGQWTAQRPIFLDGIAEPVRANFDIDYNIAAQAASLGLASMGEVIARFTPAVIYWWLRMGVDFVLPWQYRLLRADRVRVGLCAVAPERLIEETTAALLDYPGDWAIPREEMRASGRLFFASDPPSYLELHVLLSLPVLEAADTAEVFTSPDESMRLVEDLAQNLHAARKHGKDLDQRTTELLRTAGCSARVIAAVEAWTSGQRSYCTDVKTAKRRWPKSITPRWK
jgi:hypothetical protein